MAERSLTERVLGRLDSLRDTLASGDDPGPYSIALVVASVVEEELADHERRLEQLERNRARPPGGPRPRHQRSDTVTYENREIQAGVLVRRKADGEVGRIEWRRETRSREHRRFDIVAFKGVVHLPREFEVVGSEGETP